MKFKRVRQDMKFKNADNFGKSIFLTILLAVTLIPISKYITTNPLILISYCLLGVVAIKYLRVFYNDWATRKDEIGEIIIDNAGQKIILNNNISFKYDELNTVNFKFNYIKGRNYAHYDVLHNGIADLNCIISNGEKEFAKFVIESEEQLKHLKETFKIWYQKGIDINEEFTSEKYKTICLEPIADKSYVDIQEMKSELKINSSR